MDVILEFLCYMIVVLFTSVNVDAVPPEICFTDFRWDDCGSPPTPVLYYHKPGSRCEVGVWRGCLPNPNMFNDEYECVNTCIFNYKAQQNNLRIRDETNEGTAVNDTIDDNMNLKEVLNDTAASNETSITEVQNDTAVTDEINGTEVSNNTAVTDEINGTEVPNDTEVDNEPNVTETGEAGDATSTVAAEETAETAAAD